ncbi:unknown [Ruminococcus sp. CAG:379]|nr:unknown [Ruminococcus sp. CAG:379]
MGGGRRHLLLRIRQQGVGNGVHPVAAADDECGGQADHHHDQQQAFQILQPGSLPCLQHCLLAGHGHADGVQLFQLFHVRHPIRCLLPMGKGRQLGIAPHCGFQVIVFVHRHGKGRSPLQQALCVGIRLGKIPAPEPCQPKPYPVMLRCLLRQLTEHRLRLCEKPQLQQALRPPDRLLHTLSVVPVHSDRPFDVLFPQLFVCLQRIRRQVQLSVCPCVSRIHRLQPLTGYL